MASDNEKTIPIVVDYKSGEESLKRITKQLQEVDRETQKLMRSQAQLAAQNAADTAAYNEQAAALVRLTEHQRELNAEKQAAERVTKLLRASEISQSGSIEALTRTLSALRKEHRGLADEQRKGAGISILADGLNRAADANSGLRGEGQKGAPVWKQLVSSVTSWQSLLTVGIPLVLTYSNEIGNFFKSMFGGQSAAAELSQSMKSVNEAVDSESLGAQVTNVKKLSKAWADLGDDAVAKKGFLIEYRDEIDKTGIAVNDINDAENLFSGNTDAYIAAITLRAKAKAGEKLASEQYAKAIEKEIKNEKNLADANERLEYLQSQPADYREKELNGQYMQMVPRDRLIERAQVRIDMINSESEKYSQKGDQYLAISGNMGQKELDILNKANLSATTNTATVSKPAPNPAPDPAIAARENLAFLKATRQAEIDIMQEGIEKKLALQDFADEEELKNLEEKYGKQKDFAKLKTLTEEKQGQERNEIIWDSSEKELKTFLETSQNIHDITQAEMALSNIEFNKMLDEELKKSEETIAEMMKNDPAVLRMQKEEKLDGIDKKAADDMKSAADRGAVQNDYLGATVTDENKLKNLRIANEIAVREEQKKTLLDKLQAYKLLGEEDSEEYKSTLTQLEGLQGELTNLGKFGNAEGDDDRGFFRKLLNIPEGEEGDEQMEQLKEELKEKAFSLASEVSGSLQQAEQEGIDRRLKNELKLIEDEANSQKKSLEDKKNMGVISEKTYQEQVAKIDEETVKKKDAAERKAFEDKKKVDTKYAIINTALSIGKMLATSPWPVNLAMAAYAAAQGAIQVATIQSQKFAQGGIMPVGDGIKAGIVQGPSHTGGGVTIYADGTPIGEVEGGELLAVVNKRSTRAIQSLSALNHAGGGRRFGFGGVMGSPGAWMSNWSIPSPAPIVDYNAQTSAGVDSLRDDLALYTQAMDSRIDRLRVDVLESDITSTQSRVRAIVTQQAF